MAEEGTEPCIETFNERIPSPVRRIVTIPWAEVEADSQCLMDQTNPRNGVILNARLGRGKKGSNIAVASVEGSSGCKFFFLAAVQQGRIISPVPAEQLIDMRVLSDRIPFCTYWCRGNGSRRGSIEWNVTG